MSNTYYQEEIIHAKDRLVFVVSLTALLFFLFISLEKDMVSIVFPAVVLVGSLTVFSFLHYFFINTFSETLLNFRKNMLILLDFLTITYLVGLFEENGIFLLPLYMIIVMRSGLAFGIKYFYMSIGLATISWGTLLFYSYYWQGHTDILATFVMTTFLLPLFYLNFIERVHDERMALSLKLEETEQDANYDALTGAPNRKMYKEFMKEAIENKKFFTLLFIDLNKFKAINDTYGHNLGDSVLKEVVRRLALSIDEEDFLARLGGDEFVIITLRKKIFLEKFIEKLESTCIGEHTSEGVTVRIELSIGLSMYPDDSTTELMLNKYADDAMYKAKQNPNSYHAFHSEI